MGEFVAPAYRILHVDLTISQARQITGQIEKLLRNEVHDEEILSILTLLTS